MRRQAPAQRIARRHLLLLLNGCCVCSGGALLLFCALPGFIRGSAACPAVFGLAIGSTLSRRARCTVGGWAIGRC